MEALTIKMNSVLTKNNTPLTRNGNRVMKRTFDIMTASVVLIFIYPWVYIFVACGIKIFMPGPIMFKQKRTGKDGRIFTCYKFRSMDARNKSDIYVDPESNSLILGNLLRSSSIDELPQFWNVLKGDMSIIGPRPHMLVHDDEYTSSIPEYPLRYRVKPGITGWAQVNGLRGERELQRVKMRVEYDLWYIENWSVLLDLKIMFRTVGVMMKG